MVELTNELLREWSHALLSNSGGCNNLATERFKAQHGEVFRYLHSFYRLRCELNADLMLLSSLGFEIQWFTLTFDNKRDKSLVSSKRKSATRFLNSLFLCYLIVEEYGEDNQRYHIHGFGVYRDQKSFDDFRKWPCRQKIETLPIAKLRTKIKYLTKYAVKSLPRLRRSRGMSLLHKTHKRYKRLKNGFKECYMCHFREPLLRLYLNRL